MDDQMYFQRVYRPPNVSARTCLVMHNLEVNITKETKHAHPDPIPKFEETNTSKTRGRRLLTLHLYTPCDASTILTLKVL